MPKRQNVWASWNYIENKSEISVSYWMNKLQNLNTNKNFFVTLNPPFKPDSKKVERQIVYEHPMYDFKTFETQKKFSQCKVKITYGSVVLTLVMDFMKMESNQEYRLQKNY